MLTYYFRYCHKTTYMYNKLILIATLGIASSFSSIAQDKIFLSNGEVLDTKIVNVGRSSITYTRYDNQKGPEYSVRKHEVNKVRYENGSEETFAGEMANSDVQMRRANNERLKDKYGINVLSFAPVQFTEAGVAGFSIGYERVLDKNGIISVNIPATAVFNFKSTTDYYGTTYNSNDYMYYLTPGVKIYPTGAYGIYKYAVGPSLVVGNGMKTQDTYYTYGTGPIAPVSQSHFLFGMMINQSVNINPTPHLYLGSEFGFGFTYINQLAGVNQGTSGLVQFSFKIGYRF